MLRVNQVKAALVQASQLGPDWDQVGFAGMAQGPQNSIAWGCPYPEDHQNRISIPAGGSGWQNNIGTVKVADFDPTNARLFLYQTVVVFPTPDQAASGLHTLTSHAADCKSGSGAVPRYSVPGSTGLIEGGNLDWNTSDFTNGGWTGQQISLLRTYNGHANVLNSISQVAQRGNSVLFINVNASTPDTYPGFLDEADPLIDKVYAGLDNAK